MSMARVDGFPYGSGGKEMHHVDYEMAGHNNHETKVKTIRFQEFKVFSWKLEPIGDDGTIELPRAEMKPSDLLMPLVPTSKVEYLWGTCVVGEMPDQHVRDIKAKHGADICILHGPTSTLKLTDFYLKEITVRSDIDYDMVANVPKLSMKTMEDTRWLFRFRFSGCELIKAAKYIQIKAGLAKEEMDRMLDGIDEFGFSIAPSKKFKTKGKKLRKSELKGKSLKRKGGI